jgi:hypothetical protein
MNATILDRLCMYCNVLFGPPDPTRISPFRRTQNRCSDHGSWWKATGGTGIGLGDPFGFKKSRFIALAIIWVRLFVSWFCLWNSILTLEQFHVIMCR